MEEYNIIKKKKIELLRYKSFFAMQILRSIISAVHCAALLHIDINLCSHGYAQLVKTLLFACKASKMPVNPTRKSKT